MGNDAAAGALFGLGMIGFFGLILLLVIYVPLIFYLLNLQRCFDAISPANKPAVPSALVWLTLVPGIGFIVLIAAVVLLSTALKKEGEVRQTTVFGDGGMAVGLAAGVLGVLSFIPVLGVLLALGSLVCWILHWLKVSGFRKALAAFADVPAAATWGNAGSQQGWPQTAPTATPQYTPPAAPQYAPPPSPQAPSAYTPPPPAAPAQEDATMRYTGVENAQLVCIVGVLQGMSFPVGNGVVLGRSQEANITVPDTQVSNRHAWIGPVQGRLILRDMQSTNGTFLNDDMANRIQECELKEGDLIILGQHGQMKFRVGFA